MKNKEVQLYIKHNQIPRSQQTIQMLAKRTIIILKALSYTVYCTYTHTCTHTHVHTILVGFVRHRSRAQ